jgi:hypothetical protein
VDCLLTSGSLAVLLQRGWRDAGPPPTRWRLHQCLFRRSQPAPPQLPRSTLSVATGSRVTAGTASRGWRLRSRPRGFWSPRRNSRSASSTSPSKSSTSVCVNAERTASNVSPVAARETIVFVVEHDLRVRPRLCNVEGDVGGARVEQRRQRKRRPDLPLELARRRCIGWLSWLAGARMWRPGPFTLVLAPPGASRCRRRNSLRPSVSRQTPTHDNASGIRGAHPPPASRPTSSPSMHQTTLTRRLGDPAHASASSAEKHGQQVVRALDLRGRDSAEHADAAIAADEWIDPPPALRDRRARCRHAGGHAATSQPAERHRDLRPFCVVERGGCGRCRRGRKRLEMVTLDRGFAPFCAVSTYHERTFV